MLRSWQFNLFKCTVWFRPNLNGPALSSKSLIPKVFDPFSVEASPSTFSSHMSKKYQGFVGEMVPSPSGARSESYSSCFFVVLVPGCCHRSIFSAGKTSRETNRVSRVCRTTEAEIHPVQLSISKFSLLQPGCRLFSLPSIIFHSECELVRKKVGRKDTIPND